MIASQSAEYGAPDASCVCWAPRRRSAAEEKSKRVKELELHHDQPIGPMPPVLAEHLAFRWIACDKRARGAEQCQMAARTAL